MEFIYQIGPFIPFVLFGLVGILMLGGMGLSLFFALLKFSEAKQNMKQNRTNANFEELIEKVEKVLAVKNQGTDPRVSTQPQFVLNDSAVQKPRKSILPILMISFMVVVVIDICLRIFS